MEYNRHIDLEYTSMLLISISIIATIYFVKISNHITCASFRTQLDAQKKFESNMKKYKRLDGDNDLLACEHLK